MITDKLSPMLQLALRYERLFNAETRKNFVYQEEEEIWELVLYYNGSLQAITEAFNSQYEDLKGQFARIYVAKSDISSLSNLPEVIYLSLPEVYEYMEVGLGQVCAQNLEGQFSLFNVTGQGVLLAVIDSGIDYTHPDFIKEDGTTRIRYLWDLTLEADNGRVFDKAQIDRALSQTERSRQLEMVPSVDVSGHGTAMAGIAAGNGRGSVAQRNKGVAPECELIIVKVADASPRDVDIMAGINFCLERARELEMPVTLLLGAGSSLSAHNGTAPLEIYIQQRYNSWFCNFVTGTGNEADRNGHARGKLEKGQSDNVELLMADTQKSYACCIWQSFSDNIMVQIEAPNGERTEELNNLTPDRAYLFDQTAVMINISTPSVSTGLQQIFILFQGEEAAIQEGIWHIMLRGVEILQGDYYIWGQIIINREDNHTGFLTAETQQTLTSPSTTREVTSVSAYNGRTQQLASFSGRGYTLDGRIKPDLAAPGMNVTVPAAGEPDRLYTVRSGTSLSAAFVAGAYVLMMSYGIVQTGNVNLYGGTLTAFLLRGAQRAAAHAPYPNNSWGYGTLCIEAALNLIRQAVT